MPFLLPPPPLPPPRSKPSLGLQQYPAGLASLLFASSIHFPHSSQNGLFKTHSSSRDSWLKTLLELPVVSRVTSVLAAAWKPLQPLPTALYTLAWSVASKMVPKILSSGHSCLGVVPVFMSMNLSRLASNGEKIAKDRQLETRSFLWLVRP